MQQVQVQERRRMLLLGKPGHVKKDCFKWKRMQKKKEGKGEEKKDDNKGKEKVEEVNAMTYKDDGEFIFMSCLPANVLVEATDQNCGQEWILDSGASFHVTPHRSWFSTYDSSRRGLFTLETTMFETQLVQEMCSLLFQMALLSC